MENAINDKLYSTPEDAIATVRALGSGENGYYMTALTFGNVHGVYKPGNVKLRPRSSRLRRRLSPREFGLAGQQALPPGLPRRLRARCPRKSRPPSTTASSR